MANPDDFSELLPALIGPIQPPGTNETRAVAIQSLNSSATLGGLSGALGNPLDQALLQELRAWADVILVTASTARAEDYGVVELSAEQQRQRIARGQAPLPYLVLWDRSGRNTKHLLPLLNDASSVLLTQNPNAAHGRELANPPIIYSGSTGMGVQAVRESLSAARIIVEGGPHLYATMLQENLLDRLHLTIAPMIVTPGQPLFPGTHTSTVAAEQAHLLTLEHTHTCDDGLLFTRYAVRRG